MLWPVCRGQPHVRRQYHAVSPAIGGTIEVGGASANRYHAAIARKRWCILATLIRGYQPPPLTRANQADVGWPGIPDRLRQAHCRAGRGPAATRGAGPAGAASERNPVRRPADWTAPRPREEAAIRFARAGPRTAMARWPGQPGRTSATQDQPTPWSLHGQPAAAVLEVCTLDVCASWRAFLCPPRRICAEICPVVGPLKT